MRRRRARPPTPANADRVTAPAADWACTSSSATTASSAPSSSTRVTSIRCVEIWATGTRRRPPVSCSTGDSQPLGHGVHGPPQRQTGLVSRIWARRHLRCHPSSDPPTRRRSVTRCCRRVNSAVSKYVAARGGMPDAPDVCDTVYPSQGGKRHVETDRVLTLHFLISRLSHDPSSRCQTHDRGVVTDHPRIRPPIGPPDSSVHRLGRRRGVRLQDLADGPDDDGCRTSCDGRAVRASVRKPRRPKSVSRPSPSGSIAMTSSRLAKTRHLRVPPTSPCGTDLSTRKDPFGQLGHLRSTGEDLHLRACRGGAFGSARLTRCQSVPRQDRRGFLGLVQPEWQGLVGARFPEPVTDWALVLS